MFLATALEVKSHMYNTMRITFCITHMIPDFPCRCKEYKLPVCDTCDAWYTHCDSNFLSLFVSPSQDARSDPARRTAYKNLAALRDVCC